MELSKPQSIGGGLPNSPTTPPGARQAAGGGGPVEHHGILRSAYAIGGISLLSRILGLIREYVHAHYLGTGMGADAFRIGVLIPNVFRRLVGEGAIASAFVPIFSRHVQREGREAIRIFAEKFFTLWTILLALITLAGMALAGWAVVSLNAMQEAWTPEKLELTENLTRLVFPYLFLIGLSAVAGGILNSFKIFALPSATPLFYNLAFIGAGCLLAPRLPAEQAAYAFAVGVLAGGAIQLAILLPALWKLGVRPRPRWPGGHQGVREVLRLLVPGAFGAGIYQINVCISSFLAVQLGEDGPVSALGYATRLMEFVLGVFVFALSTVSVTTLSQQAASGDRAAFRATLSEVIRLACFITIPSAVGLYIFRDPIISLILQSGEFKEKSLELTSLAFQYYIPGLVFIGLNRMLVSAFYSLKNLWTPVKLAVVNLAINVILAWFLMKPMAHAGIALAATIATMVQGVCLFLAFLRRERDLLRVREVVYSIGRSLAASVVLAAACLALLPLLPGAEQGKFIQALCVLGAIFAGAAVYFTAARLLGALEATTLLRALFRRSGRG